MSNPMGRRYQYGASFVDQDSGVRFEGHHPLERPDLWKRYLNEAEGIYRSHGFEGALRRRDLEEGTGVSLFFIGFSPEGEAVAGIRFHGPLDNIYQTAIMEEMEASPEIDLIGELINSEIRLGVLEVKGVWSKGEAVTGHRLVLAISRCVTHAMNWLGAELTIGAASDRLLAVGHVTGARQIGTCAVPFPDERYRTIAAAWRRARSHELSSPENQVALRREAEQLSRGVSSPATGPLDVAGTRVHSWRPLVLDTSSRSDREVLRVLRANSSLQIIDRYDEQRQQLHELRPTPDTSLLQEAHRWVYYPWRRAMVRLLAPRPFSALRLDRNHNKVTREEQARLRALRVGVVGVSAGHSIAYALALEGIVGELRLVDYDTIELSNLNRIPASVLDLGVNKAIVAARRIAEIDPYLRVVVDTDAISADNLGTFLDGLDVVVEECDSLDMKFVVREAARERRIPVMMETSDRGVLDVERFDLEPRRPIFHGLLGDMDSTTLAGLSLAEKSTYVLRLLGAHDVSSRGAASLVELGQTITGWPQLASDVTLGAATIATAIRHFGTHGHVPSGRVRFDLEEILANLSPVVIDNEIDLDDPAPTDPPVEGLDDVETIVDAARRAPSGGNIQPWRFEADEREVRFFLTPERTTTMDLHHRASYLALGAAIFNARVAAASLRKLGTVRLFPEGNYSYHVATMEYGTKSDLQLAALYPAVATRSANRRFGQPADIAASDVERLSRDVEREGASLRMIVDREQIGICGELIAESDRLRFLIPKLHEEMMGEIRWPGRDSLEEGLDVRTLDMDPMSLALVSVLDRPEVMSHLADWRGGQALGLRSKAIITSSSALAAITIPRPDPTWYVRAGSAMERLWLNCELMGLAVQPVSPIFLFANSDDDLVELGGERYLDAIHNVSRDFGAFWRVGEGETITMVLRISHAPRPSTHSVRLPLEQVLSRSSDSMNV